MSNFTLIKDNKKMPSEKIKNKKNNSILYKNPFLSQNYSNEVELLLEFWQDIPCKVVGPSPMNAYLDLFSEIELVRERERQHLGR